MNKGQITILLLFLAVGLSPMVSAAQEDFSCNPIQDIEICIQEVSFSKSKVDIGNTTEITLVVHNEGNQTGDATVILGIRQPEGGTDYHKVEEIHNLEPGKSLSVSIPLTFEEPAGLHELNIMVFDQSEQHLFDATGYYNKIIVEENQFSFEPVGWFVSLGSIAQAALAIIALLIFVATGRFVW